MTPNEYVPAIADRLASLHHEAKALSSETAKHYDELSRHEIISRMARLNKIKNAMIRLHRNFRKLGTG